MTDRPKFEGFEAQLDAIMSGKQVLPNWEEMALSKGVAAIAAAGGSLGKPDVMNAKVPGSDSGWGHWARYFLNRTQGGVFDGSGYVMIWDKSAGRIGRFAICKHTKVAGAGANPRYGWHPGWCSKCGLDMTVDSSD